MRILSLLLVIALAACSNTKKVHEQLSAEEGDYITLERTGCFGTCPIYGITIYGDGKVSYEGKRYVDHIGSYEGQLNKEALILLFANVKSLKWDTYPEAFPIDNVDFPQFHLRYSQGKEIFKVKANSRANEELIALSQQIDFLIKDVELTKIED